MRVVFDSSARLPADSALARTAREVSVLLVAATWAPADRVSALEDAGVEVLRAAGGTPERMGAALDALGARDEPVQSLLVEGGSGVAATMVAAGLVDRVAWFLAPKLIGGAAAPGGLGDPGVDRLADAPPLLGMAAVPVGEDLLVTGRLRPLAGG
jgi:diaminohydroxyphosphoribosylaminopyrimidine deaminase/5-amino-6-(5-phosphoribosylamino)uracil reductase